MGTWLEHPGYIATREALIQYLCVAPYRFRRLSPVIFLCGGAGSSVRDTLRDYLKKHVPGVSLFYAERVWEQIASRVEHGALKMESDLAELADLVIIIVESPGTCAELGAFSLSEPLRKKLLPIVDGRYERESSFIATGPLRWIDAVSDFKPTIYVAFSQILEAVAEIEDRIARIPKSQTVKVVADLAASPKHLLFFLCDLIAVIHPATIEMIEYYLGRIAPSILSSAINVPTLVGLATAMDLLRVKTLDADGKSERYYSPALPDATDHPFHHVRLLNLSSQRAAHVSVLLKVPEARAILSEVRGTE
ncbi:MAG TPA: retron St85 family effector protein [Candidatus Dormibacteraeota bacterium]|nr:retron St85 family effector protein [Candidatus Dormibacteraeota bacterium]